ncbi:agamous-like MADS-box protein AGL19 isoform X2 [Populus alba]|nr:agamous-like MADS-box protein AGL19 isoform X2 [Populus alba]XP_034888042.1 agamous-like MADS-box protein AGL19 isoform X2 [Populus alba]
MLKLHSLFSPLEGSSMSFPALAKQQSPTYPKHILSLAQVVCINRTIERYQKRAKDVGISSKMVQDNIQPVKEDTFTLAKKIELLEVSKRKFLGEGLETCSTDDLQQLENQLERSLTRIRARKNQLFRERIEKLKGEEKILLEENTRLREKCGMQQLDLSSTRKQQLLEDRQVTEVETELFIGPPETRLAPKP